MHIIKLMISEKIILNMLVSNIHLIENIILITTTFKHIE